MRSAIASLLITYSWQELRQHPWRNAAAVVSVMLGVALAFAVHVINASALDEFAQAAQSVSGKPDLEARASGGLSGLIDEGLYPRLARHPDVAQVSPVLELSTYALRPGATPPRVLLKVIGVDALQVAAMAPDLMPQPAADADRLAIFAPDSVFLNAAARTQLPQDRIDLQLGLQLKPVRVAGHVQASGAALAVMDIGAVQDLFDRQGKLSRMDLRLRPGVDKAAFIQAVQAQSDWPAGVRLSEPGEAVSRLGTLSRAYRINLTVLALVALFTGGFLVFSVLALSVTRRAQQFALLRVLGLTGAQAMRLVLLEACALGLIGSVLGIALGTGLAIAALHFLGADLGGGFFTGGAPRLQWSAYAALGFGVLGLGAAVVGAWWPARLAQGLPPAQTLKGLGAGLGLEGSGSKRPWHGFALLLLAGALAWVPPIGGIALAAYASVALLLLGGISTLPLLVGVVLDRLAPWVQGQALPLLAVERARRVRESAAVAVSGVVAALSLAVALTVMVASFRHSVTQWLDTVLPADLYVRTANSGSANDTSYFDPAFVRAARQLPEVEKLNTQRSVPLLLNPALPAVTLIARPLQAQDGDVPLPLTGAPLAVPPGAIGIYVSEAMVDLHGARLGQNFPALYEAFRPLAPIGTAQAATFYVAGVWRDYARQFGTIAMDAADFERLSGDTRVNDLSLWLKPAGPSSVEPDTAKQQLVRVQQALRDLAREQARTSAPSASNTAMAQADALLEFGSTQSIRATTLTIFDRSFAVTYWLQAVAIGIGLFGVAASFSAQVLARRKEFGLLVHLGLTRQQVLKVVALEGLAWTSLGVLAGIALGLAVALVLVHVVNPQSFHWTMDLDIPWLRLSALGAAVIAAGTVTVWLSGRAAAGQDAVLAVKEDW
jgi:putative ABC transport system permease protein